MNSKFTFIDHSNLVGQHALFSPSQSAWLRYDDEKIAERILTQYRAPLGTEIHEFAAQQITMDHKVTNVKYLMASIENYIYTKYTFLSSNLKISDYGMTLIKNVRLLPRDVYETVRHYINDGIGYKMTTEQPLVYSDNLFGTADTISFKNNVLRIHDLKTGATQVHMEQLATYAALFCLEYGPKYNFKPGDLEYELRIYQWNGDENDPQYAIIDKPTAMDIVPIIDRIVQIEKIANKFDKED